MEKFGRSQPVTRIEDLRFLTGTGDYVSDIAPENSLHAIFVRSSVGHADVTLDLSAAKEAPGVQLVLDGEGLKAAGITRGMPAMSVDNRDGTKTKPVRRPLLADERVRFVGEAIALIVADTLDQARDAAELIEINYQTRPVHLELETGGEPLHDSVPDNRAFDWGVGDEAATEAAIAQAAHVVRVQVSDNRVISNPMEGRCVLAQMDQGRLHITFSGQNVWNAKRNAAMILRMKPDDIRVTIPDVGGGFGTKAPDYPETFVVAQAARMLDASILWVAERTETMLSDNAGRDLEHDLTLAFDKDLRITAYRIDTKCNMGAYNGPYAQNIPTNLFSKVVMGVYDVQDVYLRVEGIHTSTTQVDAYRGAGRPEAIYALERAMDYAARELGVDVWDLHRRNFIQPDQFPYVTATGETYDVGDFNRVLSCVEELCDRAGFEARRKEASERGRLRGLGLCFYIESILGDPSETAHIQFTAAGGAVLYVGTQSNGQGHETVYAQFLSEQTGIPFDAIEIVQGDSDRIAKGGGTGGSRSVTVQNSATLVTIDAMIAAFTPFVAQKMGVVEQDVVFDHETFRAPGSNLTPTLLEVAAMAREVGRDDLLNHRETVELAARSFPNGAHVCEVEVDPETGQTTLVDYAIVDDFGNLINCLLYTSPSPRDS